MVRKLCFILLTLLVANNLSAADHNSLLKEANELYQEAKFEEAIEKFELILKMGYEASELYYNLGNAYFKSNNIPKAILNYERALLLDPGNEDIQFNLELANKFIVDKIDELPRLFVYNWIDTFISLFDSNQWAFLSLAAFVLFLSFILIFLFSRILILKRIVFWFGILLFMFSILSYSLSARQKKILTSRNTAIVFAQTIIIKGSPDESGTDLFLLHEGTKVTVVDRIGNWCEIKISDGNRGWIQINHLEII